MNKTSNAHVGAASYAAMLQVVLWLTFVVFIVVINPSLGLMTPAALAEPDVLLPALERTPLLIVFPGLDLLVGCSLFVVVIALQTQLTSVNLMRFAVPVGSAAAVLFVVLATSRLYSLPELAQLYTQNTSSASEGFILLNALHDGLSAAVRLTLGFWLLLTSCAVKIKLSRSAAVVYLGIISGLLNIGSVLFQPLAGLNMILLPLWFFLVGRWMLGQSPQP